MCRLRKLELRVPCCTYSQRDSLVSDKSGSQGTGTGSAVFRIHITYIYSLIPQTHRFVFGLAILEDRPKRDS